MISPADNDDVGVTQITFEKTALILRRCDTRNYLPFLSNGDPCTVTIANFPKKNINPDENGGPNQPNNSNNHKVNHNKNNRHNTNSSGLT